MLLKIIPTPLHQTIEMSASVEPVKLLLAFGANVYMEDGYVVLIYLL